MAYQVQTDRGPHQFDKAKDFRVGDDGVLEIIDKRAEIIAVYPRGRWDNVVKVKKYVDPS